MKKFNFWALNGVAYQRKVELLVGQLVWVYYNEGWLQWNNNLSGYKSDVPDIPNARRDEGLL